MPEAKSGTCYLYILYSSRGDRYYTGISSDPERRLI
ncbi:MAG: GIY-YIG nuclease family protein, partial [Chlorobiaceae bacterium]|nr:GIY-YIG nuclease family protein [Chlorobiaceae bacterium]NTV61575.1 GIY-YIG nuclease family protein [Chlorobiaceae bacterium]